MVMMFVIGVVGGVGVGCMIFGLVGLGWYAPAPDDARLGDPAVEARLERWHTAHDDALQAHGDPLRAVRAADDATSERLALPAGRWRVDKPPIPPRLVRSEREQQVTRESWERYLRTCAAQDSERAKPKRPCTSPEGAPNGDFWREEWREGG